MKYLTFPYDLLHPSTCVARRVLSKRAFSLSARMLVHNLTRAGDRVSRITTQSYEGGHAFIGDQHAGLVYR